jgi:hypothetical protein
VQHLDGQIATQVFVPGLQDHPHAPPPDLSLHMVPPLEPDGPVGSCPRSDRARGGGDCWTGGQTRGRPLQGIDADGTSLLVE